MAMIASGRSGQSQPAQVVALPDRGSFPTAKLVPPADHSYLLLAGQVDRRPMPLPASRRKRRILHDLTSRCGRLRSFEGVVSVNVFDAVVRPPGRSQLLANRPDVAPRPALDVVVLVESLETSSLDPQEAAETVSAMGRLLASSGGQTVTTRLTNVRSMGAVDHTRSGIFLFNYFYADDLEQNLAVWEYTAGWFQDQTGLDNSTLLVPDDPASSPYTIINHCRWDRRRDVLLPLRFKRSFRNYVLAHFDANDTAPMPVLYRLVT